MPSKTITISNSKWTRLKEASKGMDPIRKDEDGNPEHTEAEHVFYKIRQGCARTVRAWELKTQGSDNAPEFDEDIIIIE